MLLIHKRNQYILFMVEDELHKLSQEVISLILQHGKCEMCGNQIKAVTPCECTRNDSSLHIAFDLAHKEVLIPLLNKERKRRNDRRSSENRAINKQFCAGTHTKQDLADILVIQGGTCYFCNKDLAGEKYHADHLVPISYFGDEWPSNMAITCTLCNLAKANWSEVSFWDVKKEKLGAKFVTDMRTKRKQEKKEKNKLSQARKKEVKASAKLLENRLNDALNTTTNFNVEVTVEDDGVKINLGPISIMTLPHAHRFVGSWSRKDLTDMVNAMDRLIKLMSIP